MQCSAGRRLARLPDRCVRVRVVRYPPAKAKFTPTTSKSLKSLIQKSKKLESLLSSATPTIIQSTFSHKITMPPVSTPFAVLRALSRSALRTSIPRQPCQLIPQQIPSYKSSFRHFSSTFRSLDKGTPSASAKPLLEYPDPATQPQSEPRPDVPSYELTFTCVPCSTRSSHKITKQGYHFGSVLITCPDCRNRHVISDHLKVRCMVGN